MPVLVPRIRTLGVRLSEEEYAALGRFCVENGARSISDLARTAICSFISRTRGESALASELSAQSAQVKSLAERVKRLTAEIASLKSHEIPAQIEAGRDDEAQDQQTSPERST